MKINLKWLNLVLMQYTETNKYKGHTSVMLKQTHRRHASVTETDP